MNCFLATKSRVKQGAVKSEERGVSIIPLIGIAVGLALMWPVFLLAAILSLVEGKDHRK